MAKNKISNEELLEILAERLGGVKSEKEGKSTEVEFPGSLKELKALDEDALQELASSLEIDFEEKDEDELRDLLVTVYYLTQDKHDKIEADAAKALAAAVGIEPAKKLEATLELLMDYFNSGEEAEESEDAEEAEEKDEDEEADEEEESEDEEEEKPKKKKSSDDEDEEESEDEEADEDEEEEKPKKKKKASDDEDEEEESEEEEEDEESDEDTVDEETMEERLTAFNDAAEKSEQIPVKKLGLKKAYAKLEALLEDDNEKSAEWGAAYIKDGSGLCCGLEMSAHTVKGDKEGQYGKCRVTGKVFKLNEEEDAFLPYKPKK